MLGRAHGNGRFNDKHAVARDELAEVLGDVQYRRQVGRAVLTSSGVDGTEHEVLVDETLLVIARENQPLVSHVAVDHVVQTRLVDGYRTIDEAVDLLAVPVNTGHINTQVGKARAAYQTDISCTNYRNVHNQ